jgi:L-amino acid N-acyltransferase YncA
LTPHSERARAEAGPGLTHAAPAGWDKAASARGRAGQPLIRDLDLDRDADQIAQLYQRYGYGAAVGNGLKLTGAAFRRMMAENDLRECLVAEADGRVVALLGALAIDGARATAPGTVRGNHFILETSARGSIIAGQLFQTLFERLVRRGVGSIWVRVNPKNRHVVGLYVRAGFRAIGHARADEDGFTSLVSHLPGVLAAVRAVTAQHPELGVYLPQLTLTTLRGGRGAGFDEGVTRTPDGRWWVRYRIVTKDLDGGVVMDGETGRVLWIGANGVDYTDGYAAWVARQDLPQAPPPGPAPEPRRLGEFTVALDGWGGLRVTHPRHLGPVVADCFPDGAGHLVAYRCPPPKPVTTEVTADGWTSADAAGLVRRVTLTGDTVDVDCALAGAAPGQLAVHPAVGLRTAELTLTAGGRTTQAPVRPGRWPIHLPAYEAAGDAGHAWPSQGATATWSDEAAGLGVTIDWADPGRLRLEGECRADGPRLRYRLRLQDRGRVDIRSATPKFGPQAWAGDPSHPGWRRLKGPQAEIVADPAVGLVSWRAHGVTLLAKPAGQTGFGGLARVPAAVWASLDTDRSDLDRGPEWSGADDRITFLDPGQPANPSPAAATWTVAATGDLAGLELTTHVPGDYAGLEAALTLKPAATITTLQMADSAGALYEASCRDGVDRPWGLWWGFTRRVVLPAGPGRALDIRPVDGDDAEILVRSVTAGFLITLLSRVGPKGSASRWSARLGAAFGTPGNLPPDSQPRKGTHHG